MARKRFSMRRFLLLVLVLVALVLLLEMNRWLPGGWPGGGGGGFQARDRESLLDETRVRPAEEPVAWPPPEGVRVEVRSDEGAAVDEWTVAAGDVGAERPGKGGPPLSDPVAFLEGFRVRHGDWTLRHRAPPPSRMREWVVHVPAAHATARPTTSPTSPTPVRTRVVDAKTGTPLPNAEVRLVREGVGRPVDVGTDATLEVSLRDAERAGAHLEVRVEGRPVAIVRADAIGETVAVAEGRMVEVKVTDANRRRPSGATVTARYGVLGPGGTEPIEASARAEAGGDGTARIAVPTEGAVHLLAEGLDRAPAARRITSADGGAPIEIVLDAGLSVPVRVTRSDGSPADGAEVIAVAAVDGVRVERRALAGGDGRASVGPFAAGEVELYAKAPGHAWAAATATAASASGTTEIRLATGAPLTLIVETPEGRPVGGARVRVSPEEDGVPDVAPPSAPPWETDAKGVLVTPDLPDRPFTVRISAPGFQPERLARVRPGRATYFATLVPE